MATPSQKLVSQLQTFSIYKEMDEKQVRIIVGKKYDLKRARNSELKTELNNLTEMVRKSKKSKKEQDKEPILVNDTLREILLRADVETIHQYCLTTKEANKLCNDLLFNFNKRHCK